jgi:hypothetical protein
VGPGISPSLLRRLLRRSHGGRQARVAALVVSLVTLAAGPARADLRPDPPPAWATTPETSVRPDLPPAAERVRTRTHAPATVATATQPVSSADSASKQTPAVRVRTTPRHAAQRQAQRPRPTPQAWRPPQRSSRHAGSEAAVAAPRDHAATYALVGLAALLLAFGSGSLAVTVRQLRVGGT